jgi:uncharacterized protein (TIGR01777 family)
MRTIITGGLGFVGRQLSLRLLQKGHEVLAIGLRATPSLIEHPAFRYLAADTTQKGKWLDEVASADAVVNLAGKTILKRWTTAYKEEIYNSRILTTRNIVGALPNDRPVTLCSCSAVGFYGDRGEDALTESEPPGADFLARVGIDWEAEAYKAEAKGVRVVALRFGIVLGKGGGALASMLPAFRMFAGGPLGSGQQWFPWIHMADLLAAIDFIIHDPSVDKPVNLVAPHPVRNRELARTLGKVLNRPAVMPAPAFMIRMAMGELGGTLLVSQKAIPQRLLRHGFEFQFSELKPALENLLLNK